MPDLIAKPALGHAPLTLAGTTLTEEPQARITAIAPFPGQTDAVARALGMAFPAPGQVVESGGRSLVWAGRDIAFLIGDAPTVALAASVTDQSDAWVTLVLRGPQAVAALARLMSLDLRRVQAGQCFRTGLNHMPLVLIVEDADRFRLMTFRSMAQTAWHEVQDALEKVAARAALTA